MLLQTCICENFDKGKFNNQLFKLCCLVKDIVKKELLPTEWLLLGLDTSLLRNSGLHEESQAALDSRIKKVNTNLYYKQQKYNLLREETEGFSKIVTMLSSLAPLTNATNIPEKSISSVIGHFELEPNRMIDIILDFYELNPWNTSYLTLLHRFSSPNIAQILGFKFSCYQTVYPFVKPESSEPVKDSKVPSTSTSSVSSIPEYTPKSLYILTAILIAHKVVSLEDIVPYLGPSPTETKKKNIEQIKLKKEQIRSYGFVSLNKNADNNDDKGKAKGSMSSDRDREEANNTKDANSSRVPPPVILPN